MEDLVGADTQPAAHGGPQVGAGGCALKEAKAGLWRGHAGAMVEELHLVEGPML